MKVSRDKNIQWQSLYGCLLFYYHLHGRRLNINCYILRKGRQNGRHSVHQLSSAISLPHAKLTHDLRTPCCFSAHKKRVGTWTPHVGWVRKEIFLLMTRDLRRGGFNYEHIHVLPMGNGSPSDPIQPVPSGLSPEEPPLRRSMDSLYDTPRSCPHADVIPHMPLPGSGRFQSTRSCTRLWSMRLMSAPSSSGL